jgi:hypothetical protein
MTQDTKQSAIEAAARAFVKFNADNEWSLSQVQGFRYGQDHVVRDCMLPGDRQEIWRRPASDTSPEDMRDFIDLYRAQQAMGAAVLAYLSALVEDEGAVEAASKDILALWKRYDGEMETGFGIIHSGVNHAGLPPEDSSARVREVSADFARAVLLTRAQGESS